MKENELVGVGFKWGYEYAIVIDPLGCRCGYVRVNPDNELYGMDAATVEGFDNAPLDEYREIKSTGQTPCRAGLEEGGWWIGFDTYEKEYKSHEYVRLCCQWLVESVSEFGPDDGRCGGIPMTQRGQALKLTHCVASDMVWNEHICVRNDQVIDSIRAGEVTIAEMTEEFKKAIEFAVQSDRKQEAV